MSDIAKKIIRMSLIGFILGLSVGLMIMLTGGFDYLPEEGKTLKLVIYMVVSGLMGTIGMGFTVVYDIESWSIATSTVIHFAVTTCAFFAMGFIEGWYSNGNVSDIIITFVFFVVAYFIIWLVMYLKYNRQVRKMNEDLKAIRNKQDDSKEKEDQIL